MLSKRLKIEKGITSFIGGGGKTSLILTLAEELKSLGSVLITTTTNMYEPQIMHLATTKDEVKNDLKKQRMAIVGSYVGNGKISQPDFDEWEEIADYILVEADGSKHLPVKAHAYYEPCVPNGNNKTILVIGNHAFMRPISSVSHRPELYAKIAETSVESLVTPQIALQVIETENLHDIVVINKSFDDFDYFKYVDLKSKNYPVYFEKIPLKKY